MKGIMAGTRARASTLSDGVFTVSDFSFRRAPGRAAFDYRTASTLDTGGWIKGDKEERNRADQISPRRPEVHRVGVMHLYPNDGLNFCSPDPWWCISDIRSGLEDRFASYIPPHATLNEVVVSQTVSRLHISIGSCGANRRGGEGQPRHSSPSTTETTNPVGVTRES
jgi:hypothetical protein